jgi:hypothetical protein
MVPKVGVAEPGKRCRFGKWGSTQLPSPAEESGQRAGCGEEYSEGTQISPNIHVPVNDIDQTARGKNMLEVLELPPYPLLTPALSHADSPVG